MREKIKAMKNPFRNVIRRPKHPLLFLCLYFVGLMTLVIVIDIPAGAGLSSWADKGAWWRRPLSLSGSLVTGVVVGWWANERWMAMRHRLFCLNVEFGAKPTDEGEFLEYGPGWRKFRWDMFTSQGHGRLAQHGIEWVTVAINARDLSMQPVILEASSSEFYVEASQLMKESWAKGEFK